MNNEEKFGVKIVADTDKASFDKALSQVKSFENEVGDLKIGLNVDGAKLRYIRSQIDDIKSKLKLADQGYEVGDVFKLEYQLAKLQKEEQDIVDKIEKQTIEQGNFTQEVNKTEEAVRKTKKSIEETEDAVRKTGSKMKTVKIETTGFNDKLKTAKKTLGRIVLSLVGARSVYTAIRKAMSNYLSQNEELQNKLNACWYALGSMFAPVLEKIVNWFIKLVSYVNVFAKALGFAGIDMSNFNKNAKESAKSINKALAGFDEINNLNNDSSSSSVISDPFANVTLNQGIVDFLQGLGETLKPFIDFFKEHPIGTVLGVASGYGLLKGVLGLLNPLFSNKNSLLSTQNGLEQEAVETVGELDYAYDSLGQTVSGLSSVSVPALITALGGIGLGISAVTGLFKEHDKELENNAQETDDWANDTGTTFDGWKGKLVTGLGAVMAIAVSKFTTFFSDNKTKFKDWKDKTVSTVSQWASNTKTNFANWKETTVANINNWVTTTKTNVKGWATSVAGNIGNALESSATNVYNWASTTASNFANWCTTTANNISNWGNSIDTNVGNSLSNAWTNFKNFMSSTGEKIKSAFNMQVGVSLVGVTAAAIMLRQFSRKGMSFAPSYDVGTNYVPNDQLAMVHKGEAIIPKKFNNEEFLGNSNQETNALLQQLIDVVNSKDFKAYISTKEIGKASVEYINSRSRIMGGSLV